MTRGEVVLWLKAISTKKFVWDDYAMQDSEKEIRERCEQSVREAIDMAIEALSKPIVDITQRDLCADISCTDCPFMQETCKLMDYVASAEAVQGWIPIKYHEVTESERKENGYPKDWVYFLDCEMPQDGQEILVQAKNGEIRWDVCYEDDGFSLDSGWDWKDDIIAWMPLPEPYKGGDDE